VKVLIIGSGGREHALAWKVAGSPQVEHVYVAPGNAGTALEPGVENVDIASSDISGLKDFARAYGVGLTIVGPEDPLVAGITDRFTTAGLPCFGPTAAAARLEGSKAFAKDFMVRHGIPTAAYGEFTDPEPALAFVREQGCPIVIKADGLAAGKGVIIAADFDEAEAAIRSMLADNAFGAAGHRVVVEEFLYGEEASFIVMADGKHILPLATSQDHKAVGEGDTGLNTGGMGAYSPAPAVDEAMHLRVMEEVIRPTIEGMSSDGSPFTGFLYAGLMISPEGEPKVLEYNVRFGDPETQPVMMRLQSDLVRHCLSALDGSLEQETAQWDTRACLGVVMAAAGYPEKYGHGHLIAGLDSDFPESVKVFHAGTKKSEKGVVTSGGRVLCVCALAGTVTQAQSSAYEACDQISWDGAFCRKDIGYRAVNREAASRI
jgi:phosphoribosylamine--glycine ligase